VELLPTELVLRASCGCPPGVVTRRVVTTIGTSHADSAPAKQDSRGVRQATRRIPVQTARLPGRKPAKA